MDLNQLQAGTFDVTGHEAHASHAQRCDLLKSHGICWLETRKAIGGVLLTG